MSSSYFGVFNALVVSTLDPDQRGRVTLQIPQLMGTGATGWAEPAVQGFVRTGDQVFCSFEGGDVRWPLFWPKPSVGLWRWQPMVLDPDWTATAGAQYAAPSARLTEDGMIEIDGVAVHGAGTPAPGNNTIGFLPPGIRPKFDAYTVTATNVINPASSNTVLAVRLGIYRDGSIAAYFPQGAVGTWVLMSGVRVRAY